VSEASSGNISEKILNKRETAKDKTSDESKLPQVAASKSPVSVCNPDVPKKGMGSGVRVRLRDKANINVVTLQGNVVTLHGGGRREDLCHLATFFCDGESET